MREAPLTDGQKTDRDLYVSYASRVGGRGVTAQSKDGSHTRRKGGAAMNSSATELEFTRRRAMRAIVKVFVGWTRGLIQKEELRMRKLVALSMAATLVVAAAALPTPAAATKLDEAAGLCAVRIVKTRDCHMNVSKGGTVICVDNTKSGQGEQCVYCADEKSDCKVLFLKTPEGQRLPIAGSEGMVQSILTVAPGKGMPRPPVAPVQPPPVAR